MKRTVVVAMLVFCWVPGVLGAGTGSGGVAISADGLIQFNPPQARGCVAARIEVPIDKMIVGMRWYNGTTAGLLPKVLVATGNGDAPPIYSQAITVAEEVAGQDQSWSAIEFASPLASESGTLFLIVEYPANYSPPAEGLALGVGYARQEASYTYFVSGDGEAWTRVSSRCRVLLEPVLANRAPGVVALRGPDQAPKAIPLQKLGLYAAPNPFNPQTEIALYLREASTGDIRIYDIRGRLVVELYSGPLAQGENSFKWQGRDSSGRGVASGAYWVRARTTDQLHTIKVLLLK